MTRQFTSLMALALLVSPCLADTGDDATASADTGMTCSGGSCPASKSMASETMTSETMTSEKECSGCPMEAAMAKLPKMTYLVGTESTCCSMSAEALAEKHDAEIQYVVGDDTFQSKEDAMVGLAEATETFVSTFASTHKCEASGTLTVAGKSMSCSVMAAQRAEVAKKAMDEVEMTYLVGTESCACPMKAASLAKTTGEEKHFVIDGEETCCSVDARVRLAQAKYKAAVEALAKADVGTEADVQL